MAQSLDLVFAALADSTRRTILTILLEDDHAVTDLAAPFEMSLTAISKHLKILEAAGLITREKRGRVIWCKLEPDAMRDSIRWIESFGTVNAFDYDLIEAALENAQLITPQT